MSEKQKELNCGFVKQVLSGDTVTISRPPRNGPPDMKTIHFDSVSAPKLGRRMKDVDVKDEPYAWEAREFLRKKVIGQTVYFTAESHGNGQQLYGSLFLGDDRNTAEDIIKTMVSEGWLQVKGNNQELKALEEQAQAAQKGRWFKDPKSDHIRDIKLINDTKEFVEKRRNKPIKAVVENICLGGTTVHVLLLPDFYKATVMIHGIRPQPLASRSDDPNANSSPWAPEARFFVECRLLNRDVEIILESNNRESLVGSINHERGNIAEALVREGFARCVDWSLGSMKPAVAAALRAAENEAKAKRLRIWKDWTPTNTTGGKEYTGQVAEIANADALVVKLADGTTKKIFLASIRPPKEKPVAGEEKPPAEANQPPPVARSKRPLYDVPYMFEAREFLRKKLIGKKVNIVEDYIQPANQNYPEKVCCTVTIGGANVAEALVSKGLANVVRHRDDDQRSSQYDALMAAETKAVKSGHGIHSKKPPQPLRVVEVTDTTKAKSFLRYMRAPQDAIVEYVSSGTRFRLFLPKETRIINFLLAGVMRPGRTQDATVLADEATAFTRERCMQRDVRITVENVSGANFTGHLFVEGLNLAVALVEEGLASVHFSAEKSEHVRALKAAEEKAKALKLRIWKDFKEEENVEKPPTDEEENEAEAALESLPPGEDVIITEFTEVPPDLVFFAQKIEQGPKLEQLSEKLRQEFQTSPPIPGTYTPKKGDLCAAKFVDGEWYRAKVEKVERGTIAHVMYIDYGNRKQIPITDCAALPSAFTADPAFATQYALLGVQLLSDPDYAEDAKMYFKDRAEDVTLKLSNMGTVTGTTYAVLVNPETSEDVAERLLAEGYVTKKGGRMPPAVRKRYNNAQQNAKKDRVGIWRYGDILADDAKEFGYGNPKPMP